MLPGVVVVALHYFRLNLNFNIVNCKLVRLLLNFTRIFELGY